MYNIIPPTITLMKQMGLGLVCMLYKKAMKKGSTRTRLLNMDSKSRYELLEQAALFNINYSKDCVLWCIGEKVKIYRISSEIIPHYDLFNWQKSELILNSLKKLRELTDENNIRLTVHPDQFCVLNSEKDSVLKNSLDILNHHYLLSELLNIEIITIHTGSKQSDYKERFIKNCNNLNEKIKSKLVLENCHYVNIDDVLDICYKTNLKPCLDFHHNRVKKSKYYDLDYYVEKIKTFWDNKKPIAHISSGKEFVDDKRHADFISVEDVKKFKKYFDIFDIEIEAKAKNKAILKLKKDLSNQR